MDLATAMETGDYFAAYAAFVAQPDAGSQGHMASSALLLAMTERFADAEQLLARAKAPAVEWLVRGERARLARYRDPAQAGRIGAIGKPTASLPYYAALSYALVARDAALAQKTMAEYTPPPIAGQILMFGGPPKPFRDLQDYDDGIGKMFELYYDNSVSYVPFESVKRIEWTTGRRSSSCSGRGPRSRCATAPRSTASRRCSTRIR